MKTSFQIVVTYFIILFLSTHCYAQCNCNLLSGNFFTGDYTVTQTVSGSFGFAFSTDGSNVTVNLSVTSNNERSFEAIYFPAISTIGNTYTLNFNNCEATFINQDTGLTCDGNPFILGSDTGGTYSNIDDTSFTVVYQEDATNSCDAPFTVTLNFTKVNSLPSLVNIPDPNFEQALIDAGIDNAIDGTLDVNTAVQETHLVLNPSNIQSIEGIEAFIDLEVLDVRANMLTEANLANNCKLQTLILSNNQITNLNLANNPELTTIDLNGNNLTSLNIQNGNNTAITSFLTVNNPELNCIEVDDIAYANTNFTNIDPQTSFNISCSEDYDALLALYNSTGGANWTNTWDLNTNINTFYGVTLDANNKVTNIVLNNNNLVGTLPPELGDLSNLKILALQDNQLTGSIPSELGNLTNLLFLDLWENQLTSSIPNALENLTNLTRLDLNNNQLTGTIPVELSNLTNLESLYLFTNELTGTIPSELGNLTQLTDLALDRNNLTGSIPSELGNLTLLSHLYLNNNNLNGIIPTEIGNLTNLQTLAVSNNQFTGSIPTELGNLTLLTHLYLNNNNLNGIIPTEIGNLTTLQLLAASNNQFTGNIPTELGSLINLDFFSINNNQLSGTIPSAFSTINNLIINIAENNFVFSDFETDFTQYQAATSFTYAPQNNFDIAETLNVASGTLITLTSIFTNTSGVFPSASNTYQWYKDGVAIAGGTDPSFDIPNPSTADAGVYTLKVNNSIVTGLELERNPITLNVNTIEPNYILVTDTTILKNTTENVDLQLVNSEGLRGFQFDFTLPTGFVFDTNNLITTARIADFQTSISDLGNNTYRILGFSLSNAIIPAGDGAIVSLPILVESTVTGGEYTFDITNTVLSNEMNMDVTTAAVTTGVVTVTEFPLGDSNGNGIVDVLDLLQTIDFVLGNNPSPFIFSAADVNMDGIINILDVVGTQDIILNPGNLTGESDIVVTTNAIMPMENYLLVTDQNIMQGASTNIEIELENDDTVRAFQFDITLPTGFTLNTAGIAAVGRLSGFIIDSSDQGNNTSRILAFSFTGGTLTPGTDAILNLPVTVDPTVAIGDYTLPMTGVVLSDINNMDIASTPLDIGTISVSETLGVNDNEFNTSNIKMYPNPASDFINVNINSNYTGAVDLNLYDISGKLIYTNQAEKTGNAFNTQINTTQLSNGIYILNIKTGNSNVNKKLIINM